jgi:hypothetical protein
LSSPRFSCDDGSCDTAFTSVVVLAAHAFGGIRISPLFVSLRMVGTGKLVGTDHWDGNAVSVSDRVRQDNSTQNALPTAVLQCH